LADVLDQQIECVRRTSVADQPWMITLKDLPGSLQVSGVVGDDRSNFVEPSLENSCFVMS
jgi:hypothetical protein